jgi:hypothetical protein
VKSDDSGIVNVEISEEFKWEILKVYSAHSTDAEELVNSMPCESYMAKEAKVYCEFAYPANKEEKFRQIIEMGVKFPDDPDAKESSNAEQEA